MDYLHSSSSGPARVHTLAVDRTRAEALMLVLEAGFDSLIARTAAASKENPDAAERRQVLEKLETAEAVLEELEDAFVTAH
ncbi:MAG TPA: hypothetical protein VD737_09000 [Steroidobacteraceae bacterium]|nr:hypothetical protein [Steroidobacteraceae bacterium]